MSDVAKTDDRPPTETYLLANDDHGRQIVSVHVKRTYTLRPDGVCVPSELQMPLLMRPLPAPEGQEPFYETDIVPFKRATDLIVMATAHGRGRRRLEAGIRIGPLQLTYRISGTRRCIYRGRGSIAFSEPEPIEELPIRYESAYGGVDESVPYPEIRHLEDLMRFHPGVYPRNPVGKGYVVFDNRDAIDGRELPNIEHPQQLVTPDRLVTGGPDRWWRQPLPWSTDWFDKSWYPRIVHFGGIPDGLPPDDRVLPEVQLGWLDPNHSKHIRTLEDPPDSRLADAASPSLVLPFLQGNEAVELTEMTPDGRIVVRLPNEVPRIRLRHGGRVDDLRPIPHRILISTDEMGVYVVWHAGWLTPHPLPRRFPRAGDPPTLGLEGIDVIVDERKIEPLGAEPAAATDGPAEPQTAPR